MPAEPHGFLEFFAGGGMARLGLGPKWKCLFANEWSESKAESYRANFGPSPELVVKDIAKLNARDLPNFASMAWASFPCQDVSLAGNGDGLAGERSGMFWRFWDLVSGLEQQGTPLPIVVLENVDGLLTTNDGADFEAVIRAAVGSGYAIGALLVDGVHFVPQSRPRLFIVAVRAAAVDAVPPELKGAPNSIWHSDRMQETVFGLAPSLRSNWVWWRLPKPPALKVAFADLIESEPQGVEWHERKETEKLLGMMSDRNLDKVVQARQAGGVQVGTIYKRTRKDSNGKKVQRAEVRFDNISGCLRTPAGGSSRQIVLICEPNSVRSRLLSPREAARLMGLPDSYKLPENYNAAYRLAGDGLVVPAVRWIAKHLLTPLAQALVPVEA